MRKMYSAIVISAAVALTMTGCATHRDGVRTNQYQARSVNPNTLNPNGYVHTTPGTRTYNTSNVNGMRTNSINDYNNAYGTGRTYSGTGAASNNNGMHNMSTHTTHTNAYNKEVSQKIANHVSSMKGVRKATVVVYGKDAIVGLDVKGGSNTFAMTNDVRKAVQKIEPGYKVHVTTDSKLHSRIRNLNTGLTSNGTLGTTGTGTLGTMGTRGTGTGTMGTTGTGTSRTLGTTGTGTPGTLGMGTGRTAPYGTTPSGVAPLDGHPVRNFANDVSVLISDIGRTVTAPFR